jgi:hypothetical protein
VTLAVADTIAAPVAPSHVVWQGPLPEGLDSLLTDDGRQRRLTAPGNFQITHPQASRTTSITVTTPGDNAIRGTAVFWVIDEVMAEFSQFLLHGACLVKPDTDQAIALFAPSGTGKTTTSLALTRNGLALATDDAMMLENAADGPRIWGIPRGIKVDQRTAGMFDWLQPLLKPWTSEEQGLRLDDVAQVVARAPVAARPCVAVIILAKPNADGHRIEPMGKAEAMTLILSDNIGKGPTGVDAGAQARFAAIAQLVARTPAFVLSVGPDPNSLRPDLIFDQLASGGTR